MTLQQAILSGKPFRRKGWNPEDYIEVDDNGGCLRWVSNGRELNIYLRDNILADDWVTEEPKPREWWINYGTIVNGRCVNPHICLSADKPSGSGWIKVREVFE